MKKIISLVLAALILVQYPMIAASEKTQVYAENFETYEAGDYNTAGKLKINKQSEQLTVCEQEGQKKLSVPSDTPEEQAKRFSAALYTDTLPADGAKEIDVTFEKKPNTVSGVRVYTHNGNKNYYELYFGTTAAYKLTKCVSGTRTELESSEITSQLNPGTYTLEIMYSNDIIKWRLKSAEEKISAGTQELGDGWFVYSAESPFAQTETGFSLLGGGGISGGSMYSEVKAYLLSEIDDGTDWIFKFNDDFSSYTKDELQNTVGDWQSNGKKGILPALSSDLKITEGTFQGAGKSMMSVPATALYNDSSNFTTAILNKDIPAGGKQEIKVNFKTDGELVTGLRFMVHNDGGNYYEFRKNRNGNSDPGWALIKAVNNVRTVLAAGTNGAVLNGGEFSLKITYDYIDYTGVINWELTGANGAKPVYAGGAEVTDAVGSCEDVNPFKRLPASQIELISGGQNAKYSYFTDFSVKATASHEEPPLNVNDPSSVAAYLARQNSIIAAYNTAVENNSEEDVKTFLTGNQKLALSRMDRIDVSGINELDNEELTALARRLMSYADEVHFNTLDDLTAFQNRILSEIAVGALCNVTDINTMLDLIEKHAGKMQLSVNKYYTSMKEDTAQLLLNSDFANVGAFTAAFNESVIMANYNYTISSGYFLGLLETYADIIGYNKAHFASIDKSGAAAAILLPEAKANINSAAGIAAWLDNYNTAPMPTVSPVPTPSGSFAGGGGGGGGGGSFATLPKPTPTAAPAADKTVGDAPIVPAVQLYPDVPQEHWAYEAIRFLNAKNAVSGYEDGSFLPEEKITRAEFITMLMKLYTIEMPADTEPEKQFDDVGENDWFYPSVSASANAGILNGSNGMAYPGRDITRQEMAVLICKTLEYAGIDINSDTDLSRFDDDDEIDRWAFAAVKKLQTGGVVSGNNGRFEPKKPAKRCEAAQMLYKAMNVPERSVPGDEVSE